METALPLGGQFHVPSTTRIGNRIHPYFPDTYHRRDQDRLSHGLIPQEKEPRSEQVHWAGSCGECAWVVKLCAAAAARVRRSWSAFGRWASAIPRTKWRPDVDRWTSRRSVREIPGHVFPEKSAPAPVDAESPEVVCPQEPAGSPAYAPLEAPAPNEALGIS